MWKVETNFAVRLGGIKYVNTPNLVVYRGTPIFRIRRGGDGMLGIDFDVFDAQGMSVARFAKGVVVQGDEANYQRSRGLLCNRARLWPGNRSRAAAWG